jgi:cell division protein FtsL
MIHRRYLAILLPVLWLSVLVSAAGVIYAKHRARTLFVELQSVNRERDDLETEWGQLQLEQSAWSTHGFVERVANAKLAMDIPEPAEVKIVRQ